MSVVAGATPGGSKSQWRGRRAGGPGRGCAGGRVGGGGSGRSRGGEQGWWDPVWRAEKLKQLQAEVELTVVIYRGIRIGRLLPASVVAFRICLREIFKEFTVFEAQ